MRVRSLVVLAALALALAACGDGSPSEPSPVDTGGQGAGAPAPGGGLSVEQALATTASGPLLVEGYLVAPDGDDARLCTALLESYPPQCGEPSLVVEGLDLGAVQGLTSTNDPALAQVTWSDAPISVLGDLASSPSARTRSNEPDHDEGPARVARPAPRFLRDAGELSMPLR